MKIKISPEHWVDRFIRSATNGRSVSGKARRMVVVLLLLICFGGLIYSLLCTYTGIIAIPKYKKAKELLELSQRLDHNSYEYHSIFGCYPMREGTEVVSFDAKLWEELGINNPSSLDCGVEEVAYVKQKGQLLKLTTLPILVISTVVLFACIWIVLKIAFWVINADKVKEG
ncbi:hypothetical protein [Chitinophaga polysaccharea]|uniref:hypothetical protein n=1 Tax=Chitinophaga polysaccharea TaxID=1293035 RepID=UPI001159EA7F|nr:hypothetical protein [Chitinophaga polysaccharea]